VQDIKLKDGDHGTDILRDIERIFFLFLCVCNAGLLWGRHLLFFGFLKGSKKGLNELEVPQWKILKAGLCSARDMAAVVRRLWGHRGRGRGRGHRWCRGRGR